jgi:hypothetical protein
MSSITTRPRRRSDPAADTCGTHNGLTSLGKWAQMRGVSQTVPGSDELVVGPARPRRTSARRQEWTGLTARLADTIEVLEDGHYLGLQFRAGVPYYVQVAVTSAGLRAEAVSNRFLEGWQRLDATAIDRLRRLGWRPPTDIGDGPVNWWRHFDHPVPVQEVADLLTSTINRAFDVARVDQLEYRAFSRSGDTILLPGLGLAREIPGPKPASLEQRVDAYYKNLLEVDDLTRDSDGDIPIRWDDHMVFVRVTSDPDYVRVFSPVLHDLEPTAELVAAVNDINLEIRIARFLVKGGEVIVSADVDDTPAIEGPLGDAYHAVGSLASHYAGQLQARFGGATFFGQKVDPPGPAATGLYL